MKTIIFLMFFWIYSPSIYSQADKVTIEKSKSGMKLKVNGQDLLINGMNWDYYPIGTNYTYSLWKQPENSIQGALDQEMALLKSMGVNTIRVYTSIPKKWIEYIYTNYGIYTMINHTFGRYGLTLNGTWVANTEYADASTRELLLKEAKQLAIDYKDTKGLLLFLLGNENNYGLFWEGAETENIPVADRKSTARAHSLYTLFNEAAVAMKTIDNSHPIALCNGDLIFLDLIAKECPDVDVFGINVYRGISFGDLFERVKKEYGKPVLFTEFGSDAYNTVTNKEDQNAQATILKGNWREIYENAAGIGKSGNCIGGFTFQFSDGWWKHGQTKNLDFHDTDASWFNGGYSFDFIKGKNNINEEWFGICAKGPSDENGMYKLHPRSAYYLLKRVHQLNPFTNGKSLDEIKNHFDKIQIVDATQKVEKHNWQLTWSDEFNGTSGKVPDATKWVYDMGRGNNGWGNQEFQYYTNLPENASMDGKGNLVLTAIKKEYQGASYTSARIKTKGIFEQKHGRFEARLKTPCGQGLWPAFWMLGNNVDSAGWPLCGEIDIMELRGQLPSVALGTLHGPGYSGNNAMSAKNILINKRYDDTFHLFAIEWDENKIDFFVDDYLYKRTEKTEVETKGNWVYDHPFFLIFNVAVGGFFVGSPDTLTPDQQSMTIDYVRVYK